MLRLRLRPRTDPHANRVRGLWWLSPAGGVLFVVVPTLLLAGSLSDFKYRTAWRTPRLLTNETVVILLIAAGVFAIFSCLPLLRGPRVSVNVPWPNFSPEGRNRLVRGSTWLFWLTIVGYVATFLAGFSRGATPADVLSALLGQENYSGTLKQLFAPVPGITTLTQVGIAYVTTATLILLHGPNRIVRRRLLIILALAIVRSYLLTERLAILELVVPIAVLIAMSWVGDARAAARRLLNVAPLALVPMLIAVFGAFEYSRSWVFFKARSGGSFADFAVERLSGYYVTAYNNGQVGLLYDNLPRRMPLSTLEAIWTAPVIDQLGIYDRLSPGSAGALYSALERVANPEFNNPGGLSAPLVDWGVLPGMVWWALAGLLLGTAYRGFANGSTTAMLVYPPLATGVFEIPRLVYWTQGRLLPAIVGLLLVAWYASGYGSKTRKGWYRRLEAVP